ncbi:formimidoylglutamase [Legionella sp. km772]|uniref:formimidoylglutamase n=1 Tax=Legionella sp. km772 TaxID=2498111 RepID=UPI000F8D3A75|nr:formimidoylglutamase [Legionella sp. km772]RUR11161.1 formimidoylglutamase [Legionella sp. km772]
MFSDLPDYELAKPSLWQGRKDTAQPERFFQKIAFIDNLEVLKQQRKSTVFIGFASDAGVIRNAGRPGAKLGPEQIKSCLAKLPCHQNRPYIDLGTVVCNGDELESAQAQFAKLIDLCQQYGHQTVALGGGHEIAWAHYQGLAPKYPKLGIINFDAHFDIRPYTPGQPGTSGTPFAQIAAYCEEKKRPFDYCCIGIQQFGNTPSLFLRAAELKVKYLTVEEMVQQSLAWQFAFLDDFMLNLDYIYLSICLDVFAESFAPGVSAPQPLGLSPWQTLPLLKYIIQSGKVVSFDVAELSPPLDQEQKTARLAALIIAELLNTN